MTRAENTSAEPASSYGPRFDDITKQNPDWMAACQVIINTTIRGAPPIERPAIPEHEGPPSKTTSGRRQAAGPIDPSAAVDSSKTPLGEAPAAPGAVVSTPPPGPPSIDHPSSASSAPPRNPDGDASELEQTIAECAELDHSDTDNGKRLIAYFGQDLLVRAESEVAGGSFLVWADTHWDIEGGAAGASMKAQLVGPLIMREAVYLKSTPAEADAIAVAARARDELKSELLIAEDRKKELEELVAAGKRAQSALAARKQNRRKFGVSSKNSNRISNMLREAGPHMRRSIDLFNADPLLVATKTHTLRFVKQFDPECPDPDVDRVIGAKVEAFEGHRREDLITSVVPFPYVPGAVAKKWLAFMERFQPVEPTRRTVKQFAGLGLTNLAIQRFMLHHGTGANGKSVFLEVLTRVLGPSMAVGMPTEAVTGNAQKSGSQAQPEIARLFGKRMVRILELPEDQPLQVDVVKKLTGGELIPVRTLFKGLFEFKPTAKPHLSTNGQPKIEDASNAIWRRMFAVEWPVSLPESEQRDFDEVVEEFIAEAPGILNWLIEGLLDFLHNGFVVSDGIRAGVQAYRDSMDPTGPFVRDCVYTGVPGKDVEATPMYHAFVAWSVAAGRKVESLTKFGLLMKHKVRRDDSKRRHRYVDCDLHDVPELTEQWKEKLGLKPRRADGQSPEPPPYNVEGPEF